ncbi:MAG: trypsin-like serine protease [Myxococcota bacterium]
MRSTVASALALCAFVLPTTASAAGLSDRLDPSAITGGDEVAPCGYPSVVAMMVGEAQVCTGSLVAPDLVVTAAHCLPDQLTSVAFGEDVSAPARTVEIISCAVNPLYDGTGPADTALCTLVDPVDDVQPIPLASACEAALLVQPGNPVSLVGFGVDMAVYDPDGNPDFPFITSGNGIKRTTDQVLEQAKNQTTDEPWAAESVLPMVGEGNNTACFGDSGGPAYGKLPNGELRQVGIGHGTHQGDPDPSTPCDHGIWYTATVTHLTWFEDTAGRDLTPCHDGPDAAPDDATCVGHVLDPEAPAQGDWATGCQGTLAEVAVDVCVDDEGTGSTGEETSTSDGDDGDGDSTSDPMETDASDASTGDVDPSTSGTSGDDVGGSSGSGGDAAADSSGGCRVGEDAPVLPLALGLLAFARRRTDGAVHQEPVEAPSPPTCWG